MASPENLSGVYEGRSGAWARGTRWQPDARFDLPFPEDSQGRHRLSGDDALNDALAASGGISLEGGNTKDEPVPVTEW